DVSADAVGSTRARGGAPPFDFQEHLAALEAHGLLVRVDRAINKDTELHPLVRWQFSGGIAENERRAFLFTNVIDSAGRRYDIPVVVGALAASPRIYALGVSRPIDEIEAAWLRAIANPLAPIAVSSPQCQSVVITGDDLRGAGKGLAALPVPISTPGFDAAPYLTATLCITRDLDTGIQNMGTYPAALKATDRLGVRMAARIGGAGGYLHWQKHKKRGAPMPCAIVVGCAPAAMLTGGMKLPLDVDEMAVAGALAGAPIRVAKAVTVDLDVPADAEIVIEGLIDSNLLEPEGPYGAATLLPDCGKICIAVSEDIDPTNADAVFWSLAYRANPIEDVHVAPHRSAGHGPKSGPRGEESTLLIDATLKYSAPPLALPAREFMEHARGIWQELGLPSLKPQPPWHGYSLGDWAERW